MMMNLFSYLGSQLLVEMTKLADRWAVQPVRQRDTHGERLLREQLGG
jgi:hypothetical protein